jgi:prophage regulatory protein
MSLEHSPARRGVRVLRRKQLLDLLGISSTTLWDWVRTGKFPAPIDIGGGNTKLWLEEEIAAHLRAKAEERDQQLAAADAE